MLDLAVAHPCVVALVPVPLGLGDKTIEVTKIDKKVGRKI